MLVATTLGALALGALLTAALVSRPEAPLAETRLEVVTLATSDPWSFALAPDGRQLAFAGIAEGRSRLWLRSFDSDEAHALSGTDGASLPFWSPDGRSLGFFAGGELKRVEIDGGAVQSLASAVSGDGGSWGRDGTILFSPTRNEGIFAIAATGGAATRITEASQPEQQNHLAPHLLPDGRHYLYYVQGNADRRGIYVGEIGVAGSRRILDADAAAVSLASGYLLFVRQATLFAQPFDAARVELAGTPFPVAEGVMADAGTARVALAVSDSGVIAYRRGAAAAQSQLLWFDRAGRRLGNVGDRRSPPLRSPSMSPDGRRVAFYASVDGNTDVWLLDADRGVPTRFSFDPAFDNSPVWSPDGARIVFASGRSGVLDLYVKGASAGGPEELLLATPRNKVPTDWSRDGRFVLYRTTVESSFDIFAFSPTDTGEAIEVATTAFDEREPQFSPDGRWVAYQSNESGRFEVYVQPFPGPGGKSLVSVNGGAQARWRADGQELYYVSLDNRLMAATVDLGADGQSVAVGTPAPLFDVNPIGGAVDAVDTAQYVVSADGQQFLVNSVADSAPASITVLTNWTPR
jgi:Tol biopolymer transport system component